MRLHGSRPRRLAAPIYHETVGDTRVLASMDTGCGLGEAQVLYPPTGRPEFHECVGKVAAPDGGGHRGAEGHRASGQAECHVTWPE